jgi:hypothetical protein
MKKIIILCAYLREKGASYLIKPIKSPEKSFLSIVSFGDFLTSNGR